ncbi:16915_t:CDS:2 [Acaulospora colombiana]|uniref:16915_t:CDS:1 n=1 Tax=Acaulospora colombiana TaxID=27376 RepID=A0ACA9LQQ0_9GLOM|nr:16915_t:CDS:2 [Acaulospora colombiana]
MNHFLIQIVTKAMILFHNPVVVVGKLLASPTLGLMINRAPLEGRNLRDLDDVGQGDPYAQIWLDKSNHKFETESRSGTSTPVWDRIFHYHVNGQPELHLRIMDSDVFIDEEIGCARVPLERIYENYYDDFWVKLPDHLGRNNGEIRLVLEFKPYQQQQHIKFSTGITPAESAKDSTDVQKSKGESTDVLKQAVNRDLTWSKSQRSRKDAMVGPRFEQTDLKAQACFKFLENLLVHPVLLRSTYKSNSI